MKIYGPYTRKDGRQHIVIENDNGVKTSKSYPKYLLEQSLGRDLEVNETVDHIDNDFTNNDLSNLQVLLRSLNSAKYFNDNPEKKSRYITLKCAYEGCNSLFDRKLHLHRKAIKANKHLNMFFCSRSCQGKVFH